MKKVFSKPQALVALAFLLLTLLGLLTAGDYGVYCDQLSEQVILRENMKEYAVRLGDERAVAYYDALGVNRISESIEIDHGQCAYYPIVPALALIETDSAALSFIWHGYTWLWFMLGCLALYGVLREMGLSRPLAFGGMLLMYLSPRFFAEGHYNNKDMVLLALTLCCFWTGLRLLKKPGCLRGLLFSLAGAMAANTKIVGLAVWGMISLCALVMLSLGRAWRGKTVAAAAVTLVSFLGIYALLTPALWSDPAGYFVYLMQNASGFTRWPGVVVFRGMVFDHKINPLPRYYLPYMMLTTLPLYFFPLAALGQLAALRRVVKQRGQALRDPRSLTLCCATVLWALFMGYVAVARPLDYNGWRHFYFLFAGLALLAAYGMQTLWDWARARGVYWRRGVALMGCLCLLISALGIGLNHPYQYVYYNPLAPANAEEDMELDYWDVSTVNAARTLMRCDRNQSLPLVLGARDDMSWFGLDTGRTALTAEEQQAITLAEDPDAPYLFVNTTYGRIYGVDAPEGYHELFSLTGYGSRICTVYEQDIKEIGYNH